jgi:hypothetical protein
MAVNLSVMHSGLTQSRFTKESLVAGRLCKDYEFDGVKTVKVLTPLTVPMNNYTREGLSRYGTPTEMQDMVQELTLSQDRSFTMTIDKGNYSDQSRAKNAGKMLMLQIAERAVPEFDAYVLRKLARQRGVLLKGDTPLTKSNIVGRISDAAAIMDDGEVPAYDRILFVPTRVYKLLKYSDEFMSVESVADKSLKKGVVGKFENMEVVKVPVGRWSKNVNFLIVHKNAATAPVKMREVRLHRDPPGISGHLLEGREYYDCFVFAPRAVGVIAEIDTAKGGKISDSPTIAQDGSITGEEGAIIYYTTDGGDPRYEPRNIYTSPLEASEGTIVNACCLADGKFISAVATRRF